MKVLMGHSVHYLDFSVEFGARRTESHAYTNNCIDSDKVIQLPNFLNGIERISSGVSKNYNIALLCTEKNTLDCHRFSLVSRTLIEKLSSDIEHILFDGNTINQRQLEKRLLHNFRLENDLFNGYDTLLKNAYEKLSRVVAYQIPGGV
jgi:hypothetical protein